MLHGFNGNAFFVRKYLLPGQDYLMEKAHETVAERGERFLLLNGIKTELKDNSKGIEHYMRLVKSDPKNKKYTVEVTVLAQNFPLFKKLVFQETDGDYFDTEKHLQHQSIRFANSFIRKEPNRLVEKKITLHFVKNNNKIKKGQDGTVYEDVLAPYFVCTNLLEVGEIMAQ